MIPFNRPLLIEKSKKYIDEVFVNGKYCGGGKFTVSCEELLQKHLGSEAVFLTPSCTSALEFAALLFDIKQGDEVICPSFTFPTSVSAFSNRGASIAFIDVDPKTMNISADLVASAINAKTKAIVVVHYAGLSVEMDKIMEIAKKHNLVVIEDAAQALGSEYKKRPLGSIGDVGCFSFHETKNYHCGEGGAISINNPNLILRAEMIREKGTNRKQFFRGEVDKYTWRDQGSSFLLGELSAAFLLAQFENIETIREKRVAMSQRYKDGLKKLIDEKIIEIQCIPDYANKINGHIFYFLCKNLEDRTNLQSFLSKNKIQTTFHFVPLHSSEHGLKVGKFVGEDHITTPYSDRLVRLPMFIDLSISDQDLVIKKILEYYEH